MFQLYSEEEKKLTFIHHLQNEASDYHASWTENRVCIPAAKKLGIHLKDKESEVSSTVISSVSADSPLSGKVFEGDCILSMNGIDVRDMDTSSEQI